MTLSSCLMFFVGGRAPLISPQLSPQLISQVAPQLRSRSRASLSASLSALLSLIALTTLIACDDEPRASSEGGVSAGVSAGVSGGGEAGVAGIAGVAGVAGGEAGTSGGEEPVWSWVVVEGEVEGRVELSVTEEPFSLTLTHPHGAPLTLKGEGLGFGVLGVRQESQSYDPYLLHHRSLGADRTPAGLEWVHIARFISASPAPVLAEPTALEARHLGEEGWALRVALSDGRETTLRLHRSALGESSGSVGGAVRLTLEPPSEESAELEGFEGPAQVVYGYWEAPAREGENFYGLGESFDHVARRGTYRAMTFQVLPGTESGYNEAHVPIPLLISTQGVGYFFETHQPAYFDVAYERPDVVRAEQGRPEPLALHLMWGAHPFEHLNTYYELTGRPLVPPYWSFAPHFWRNVTSGQGEVEADMRQMRALKIPAGVLWIDRPYQRAYNDCTFDPSRYEAPQRMREVYRDLGFKMVLWHAPYTSEASDAWETCEREGYFVSGPLVFMNFGKLMDLTNPGAIELWGSLLERFNELDVAGYKLDYAEDIQVGINGSRLRYDFHNGETELTMHHRYATFYHNAYLRTLPASEREAHKVNGFVMGRSSAFGGQQLAHAIWPGDLDSDYHHHLDEDYWVGGLPASVIGGLTLGASGFPFYASDTGGFRNERPTQEVLTRWAWQTAFSPIMQVGGGGSSHFPWAEAPSEEPQYDEQGTAWMREAARWNIRLADYRFTWGLKARETGAPLMRPFGMAYPEDGRHPDDVYLLGPDLLIAPVMSDEGAREVPLPEGVWLPLLGDEPALGEAPVVGPATLSLSIPLGAQAVWLRRGALLPLLDEATETLSPLSETEAEAGTVSRVNTPGELTWLVAPEGVEGAPREYVNHDGARALLSEGAEGATLTLTPAESLTIDGVTLPPHTAFVIDLRLDPEAPVEALSLNGQALPWVESEEAWQGCERCAWAPRLGRALARLGAHEGAPQVISW